MPGYWAGSGYRLLRQGSDGRLTVTDDFLRSFLLRPELAPIAGSCAAELALADALTANPRAAIGDAALDAIRDTDARENYRIFLRFRARLVGAPSIEAAYVDLFRGDVVDVPPLFVHVLTQVLVRRVLGDDADPLAVRVAEMFFRPQRITVGDDGAVMAADDATVELLATAGSIGPVGELCSGNRTPVRDIDLDVLDRDNAARYWERDERHDLAVRLDRGRPALEALTQLLSRWIAHFLGVEVSIRPQREIDAQRWVWHVGLDSEASSLLNDLYNHVDVDAERKRRLLGLFELVFADPADMRAAIAGRPVYLAMAMDADRRLTLKPQNLLLNLPLARPQ